MISKLPNGGTDVSLIEVFGHFGVILGPHWPLVPVFGSEIQFLRRVKFHRETLILVHFALLYAF